MSTSAPTPSANCALQNKDNKHLAFFLNGVEYGINILRVREILSQLELTPLPNSSRFLKGIINLRGTVIPVIDLRARFDLPADTRVNQGDQKRCVIVVEKTMTNGKVVPTGLLVDQVSRVCNIDQSSIGNYSCDQVSQDYITGIAKDEDGTNKILLDIDLVLHEQESCIAKATGHAN